MGGGKGGGSQEYTVGYKYYVGMHLILHHGNCDKLIKIAVDDREAFSGALTGGSLLIDKEELFGGESREGGVKGSIDLETGLPTQVVNAYLLSKLGAFTTAFRGVTAIVLKHVYIGINPYPKPWAFRVQRIHKRHDNQTQWYDAKAEIGTGNMNPAHIIRECLNDPDWGLGYQDGDIDDTTFTTAADTLYTEGMGISIKWDSQSAIEDFIKDILKHIDAVLYVERTTGKFSLKLIRGDYDEAELLILDENNIDKVNSFKLLSFGELVNSVTVTYWDSVLGEDSTITVSDIALSQQQGRNNAVSKNYKGFTNTQSASTVAQRDLKQLSTPLISCTIDANRDGNVLNIGSAFKLTWPDYNLNELIMRVTGISYGDGTTNKVKIQCVQDVFATPTVSFITAPPIEWIDPSGPPIEVPFQIAIEAPYLELVQSVGQTQIDSLLAANPDIGYVQAAAARPTGSAIYSLLFTDPGAAYSEVGKVDFAPSALLDENITRIQTSFLISNQSDFEQLTVGSWFQIGEEIMAFVSIVTDTLTVQRGVLDTVPIEHTISEWLLFCDYYSGFDATEYTASDDIDVKLPTVSGGGQLSLAASPISNIVLDSRAIRPYPPGDFKVNNEYFPVNLIGDLVLTWTSRNRLQQTGNDLIDFFDGDITSEVGLTYTVRLLTQAGSLLEEQTGITIQTATVIPANGEGFYRLQLLSVRDGYESYQVHDFEFEYFEIGGQRLTEDGDDRQTEELDNRFAESS